MLLLRLSKHVRFFSNERHYKFFFFKNNTTGIDGEWSSEKALHLKSLCSKQGDPQLWARILIPAVSVSLLTILCPPPRNIFKSSSWILYSETLSSI